MKKGGLSTANNKVLSIFYLVEKDEKKNLETETNKPKKTENKEEQVEERDG